MPQANSKGDIGSGRSCHFPPGPCHDGSPNVHANNRPLMRVGDAYVPYGCPTFRKSERPCHLAAGSATVLTNCKPATEVKAGGGLSGMSYQAGNVLVHTYNDLAD